MTNYDLTILTESRYVDKEKPNAYEQIVIEEDKLVIEALEARGLKVNRVDWAGPDYDWNLTNNALFRSTWDYFDRINEFTKWIDLLSDKVNFINPVDLLLWNLDKHYLQELAVKGINITETLFIEPGAKTSLKEVFQRAAWPDAILKPAVSGSARHTYRLSEFNIDAYEDIFQNLIASETMLLQPFQKSVQQQGEVSLMYFDGQYSHGVLKVAKPGDFRVQSEFGGTVNNYLATTDEIKLGEKAIKACKVIPSYARVDIIMDNSGHPSILELELIEPELWFRLYPAAAYTLADAVIKKIVKPA